MTSPINLLFQDSFLRQHMMGPNALLIARELTRDLPLKKGMRILDLGCGAGITSLFLAHQFDATIYAVDLWISSTDNWQRFKQFGMEDRIIPLNLDAHELPFAEGYFDAVISIDAYQYFGHKPGYLETHLAPLVKPGGLIAVAVPGLQRPLVNGQPPEEMLPWWQEGMYFFTSDWWKTLWEASGAVSIETCREMDCCKQAWDEWLLCDSNPYAVKDRDMMAVENGQYFNLVQIVGKVN
ncbi:methyltransferase domain-containing protein [Budviciaceae bacterium CWB-B4]|uniref:Methyltransferase domain-containing protein n=1 Tax=Limnobaculum xujianqingii TaxID=2738837 RepID=A0A9D7AFC3_9GAMM|nr:methyltransferase domain-containing protein [Limnobaculum xujianqingii]MBK5071703.1 methyltransferase domain-containing protein [Limnobaculum xujianqingii]MBK5175012.1 methyltransferase domain-containing protein [Limnobaculum xujianqingii]